MYVCAVTLMSTMWRSNQSVKKWILQRSSEAFEAKYDEIEKKKAKVGCTDDLITGLCSLISIPPPPPPQK